MNKEKSELDSLKDFIRECAVPIKHGLVFYTYFFIIIIGIGAIGLWGTIFLEIKSNCWNDQNVLLSIIGFALPMFVLLGEGVLYLGGDDFTAKFFRILLVIPPVLVFLTFISHNTYWAYVFAILSVLSSLFFWWILNANNKNLRKSSLMKSLKDKENELNNAINP